MIHVVCRTFFPGAAESSVYAAGLLLAQLNGWSGWLAFFDRIFLGSCQTYEINLELHTFCGRSISIHCRCKRVH